MNIKSIFSFALIILLLLPCFFMVSFSSNVEDLNSIITAIDFENDTGIVYNKNSTQITDGSFLVTAPSQSGKSFKYDYYDSGYNVTVKADFNSSIASQYEGAAALTFWVDAPAYYSASTIPDLGIKLLNDGNTFNLSTISNTTITFVNSFDKSIIDKNVVISGGKPYLHVPSDFIGFVIIPVSLFDSNGATLDFTKATSLNIICDYSNRNDRTKSIYIDTVGVTKNIDNLLFDLGVGSGTALDTLNVGLDFSSSSNVDYYKGGVKVTDNSFVVNSPSYSGKAFKFDYNNTQLEASFDTEKDYSGSSAFVFWLTTPVYSNPTGVIPDLDIGLINNGERWTLSRDLSITKEIIYVSLDDKEVIRKKLTASGGGESLFKPPSDFNGFVIIPLSIMDYKSWGTSVSSMDLSSPVKISLLGNWTPEGDIGKSIYLDNMGFTTDITDFFNEIGAVDNGGTPPIESPYWVVGTEFEKNSDIGIYYSGQPTTEPLSDYFSTAYSRTGRSVLIDSKQGVQMEAYFNQAKSEEYGAANGLVFWLKAPDNYLVEFGDKPNLNIGFVCSDPDDPTNVNKNTRWVLNQNPTSGMKVIFSNTKTNTYEQVPLTKEGGGVFFDVPAGFEGYVVVPFSAMKPAWGPATTINASNVVMFNVVYEWMNAGDENKAYYYDSPGFIKDLEGFMKNIAGISDFNPVDTEEPDTRFWAMSRDFEANAGYMSVNYGKINYVYGISPYKRALSIESEGTGLGPFLVLGVSGNQANYIGSKALVFWIKTPDNPAEQHKFRLGIDDYRNPFVQEFYQLSYEKTLAKLVNPYGNVEDTVIYDNQINIPNNYEGWVVIPFESFEQHSSYGNDNGVLDIENSYNFQLWYDSALRKGPYYFDELGFTTDVNKFISSVGGENDYLNSMVVNDFNDAQISDDQNSHSATVINLNGSVASLSLTDEISAFENGLKIDANADSTNFLLKNNITNFERMKKNNAIGFWINSPSDEKVKLSVSLLFENGEYSLTKTDRTVDYIYLINGDTGEGKIVYLKNDYIEIPENFVGYIAMPSYSFKKVSGDAELDLFKLSYLKLGLINKETIYIDDLSIIDSIDDFVTKDLNCEPDKYLVYSISDDLEFVDEELIIYKRMNLQQLLDCIIVKSGYTFDVSDIDKNEVFNMSLNAGEAKYLTVTLSGQKEKSYLVKYDDEDNYLPGSDDYSEHISTGDIIIGLSVLLLISIASLIIIFRKRKAA